MKKSFKSKLNTTAKSLDAFDRVFILNLKYCPERRKRALAEVSKVCSNPIVVDAISGDQTSCPEYWKQGAGAWGCLRSHARIFEDVLADESVQTFAILEDDVIFSSDTNERLPFTLKQLPSDWGQFYLGGQHLKDPVQCGHRMPGLLLGRNINRTHAIGYHKAHLKNIYRHINHAPDYISNPGFHIDHQLGVAHERGDWPVFAPVWWFAGQGENNSNISGKKLPDMWWHNSMFAKHLPLIYLKEKERVSQKVLSKLHFGNHLIPGSLKDQGLFACQSFEEVIAFCVMIRREAFEMNKLPAICFDRVLFSDLVDAFGENLVLPLKEANVFELADYTNNKLFTY
jgi:hypothetical protein